MYVKLDENGIVLKYPYSKEDLKAENPSVSFPDTLTSKVLDPFNVKEVSITSRPLYNKASEKVVEDFPVEQLGGWFQQWKKVPLSAEEKESKKLEIEQEIQKQVQSQLDSFAQSRYYNNILSATSYINSTNPKFASEAQYALELRDNTWSALLTILNEVTQGTRDMPSSLGDIIDELPLMQWPDEV